MKTKTLVVLVCTDFWQVHGGRDRCALTGIRNDFDYSVNLCDRPRVALPTSPVRELHSQEP